MTDNAAAVAVSQEARSISKPKPNEPSAWVQRFTQSFIAPERRRLYGDIEAQRSDLAKMMADSSVTPGAWSTEARSLLDRASQEMRAGDIDCGWKFLHEAQRQSLFGFGVERLMAHKLA